MLISIVIPAFNEAANLEETLHSIKQAAQTFLHRGWGFEYIVCDNNSNDGTSRIAEALGARVVFEPINQISRARNKGASIAKGEWLIFIDADSRPSSELMNRVALEIEGRTTVGGGATVLMESNRLWFRFCVSMWNLTSLICCWAAGSFIFCRKDAFDSLGGFSEELYAAEEINFSRRLKKWARPKSLKFKIIRGYPLWSSSRKDSLYTTSEWMRFFRKAIFSPMKTLKQRQDCQPWYDGRR